MSAGVWGIWWSLTSPEFYDEKYESGDMRIFQSCHQNGIYQIAEATRKQLRNSEKTDGREDVTGLVEATDAGRRGRS